MWSDGTFHQFRPLSFIPEYCTVLFWLKGGNRPYFLMGLPVSLSYSKWGDSFSLFGWHHPWRGVRFLVWNKSFAGRDPSIAVTDSILWSGTLLDELMNQSRNWTVDLMRTNDRSKPMLPARSIEPYLIIKIGIARKRPLICPSNGGLASPNDSTQLKLTMVPAVKEESSFCFSSFW